MRPRSARSLLVLALSAALLPVALGSGPAGAKEESKIQISLDPLMAPASRRTGAKLRTQFAPGSAGLQLQVRGLAPDTEYQLLSDGMELTRFTTSSNGQANVKLDLLAPGSGGSGSWDATPLDPRGTELTLNDGSADVMAGWLYGPFDLDPSRTLVKETTELAPDAMAAPPGAAVAMPSGTVVASYMTTPNRNVRFRVQLIGAPPGDYDLLVDGLLAASFSTNPAGNASVEFRSNGKGKGAAKSAGKGKGKGKGNTRLALDFDPRGALLELQQGGTVLFSGPMIAQIDGLNVCDPLTAGSFPLALEPGQSAGAGSVELGVEDDCSRTLTVDVSGLAVGDYDVLVDGTAVGMLTVADDGAGGTVGSVVFDTTPDTPDELLLDFALPSGATIAVAQGGVAILSASVP